MLPKKLCAAMLMCAATGACVTPEPLKIVTDTSCTSFRAISFAQLAKGQADDPGNKADSAPTVEEIMNHNARFDALCNEGK